MLNYAQSKLLAGWLKGSQFESYQYMMNVGKLCKELVVGLSYHRKHDSEYLELKMASKLQLKRIFGSFDFSKSSFCRLMY